MLEHQNCSRIRRDYGSPFYVFDPERFSANYRRFEAAFRTRYPDVRVGYSYKTNYIPDLCRLVKEFGGVAEIVSRMEYDLARKIGNDPARILFNGPLKEADDLEYALTSGSAVNLDGDSEVEIVVGIARRHPERAFRVGLRVNMDLSDRDGRSYVQDGLSQGRFGFSPERLPEIVNRLNAVGIVVDALHGHSSSSSRSLWIFRRITATLCELAALCAPETIREINVGGGFFGNVPPEFEIKDVPSFDDYAQTIVDALTGDAWASARRPRLMLEPGTALAADTLSFVTRVVDVKRIGARTLAVVDGNILQTKPSGHSKRQPCRDVLVENRSDRPARRLDIVGSTCMERDVLAENVESRVERGDFLEISHLGAYSVVMSPAFIHPAPAIVVRRGNEFAAVRRRQTLEQVFAGFLFSDEEGETP